MNNNKNTLIRWILVLPIAIVSYLLVFLAVAFFDFFHADEDKLFSFLPIFSSAIAGAIFIKVGHYIAPKFKKQVGFILLLILLTVSVVLGYYSIIGEEYFKLTANVAQVITGTLTFISLIPEKKNQQI